MSVNLANGATFAVGSTYAATKTVSATSNANPGSCTATSNGYTTGDFVVMSTPSWTLLDNRVVRVTNALTNSFDLEGIDTSSTTLFPASQGSGTASKITAWTALNQVLACDPSGGDQQFTEYSFMDMRNNVAMPTVLSAMSLKFTLADDSTLGWWSVLKTAAQTNAARALKVTLPSGAILLYYGYFGFNETPSLTKNNVMAVTATFSLLNTVVRYSS